MIGIIILPLGRGDTILPITEDGTIRGVIGIIIGIMVTTIVGDTIGIIIIILFIHILMWEIKDRLILI